MQIIAWGAIQIAIAGAAGYGLMMLISPSYMDAPAVGKTCFVVAFFCVSLPFTLAVTHFAPILKEKQRAARRRRAASQAARIEPVLAEPLNDSVAGSSTSNRITRLSQNVRRRSF
jgi:hypothetical protein